MTTTGAVYVPAFHCRFFSAGGFGRLTKSPAAWGTHELRIERRRRVAMDPLHTGAVGLVGSALRVPARTQ